MRWCREEYIELMTFGDIQRPMFVELFGPLVGLDTEWKQQGASNDEINLTAFDFDYMDLCDCGGNTGILGGFTPRVLEENSNYRIEIDAYGRKTKLSKGYATIPLPLEYPVTDMDGWLKIKPWFEYSDRRINWDRVEFARKQQEKGALILASIPGGFDIPRELMGDENACYCYYDDSELMHDILNTISDTAFNVLDRISDKLTIDNLTVHEDMAGKSGPLVGPNIVNEFIKPYYLKVWDMLNSKGTKLFSQDSDGNMTPIIDAFIQSGVNVMFPAEPAAGMDIVSLRSKYGNTLAFKGGIDKHVLRKDKKSIRDELEYKLQPVMHKGTVFGIDHRIPNGTPIENYRYYVDTAREILNLPPVSQNRGWRRMAF